MPQTNVQVYTTDGRDEGHHADGYYDNPQDAIEAARHALLESEVTEVRLVKQSSRAV